ncbi:nitrogenase iron protein 2 [Geobacter sp. OR-1]|uniref:nucleotide-binding protein n=1 Tax=Geobacter sp. OR-1 TaxID=1266765 RepID=UPI0005437EBA|nr:P-loop NTPase [Geobacter sp. OR-1]GAM10298.1 nitrogenase iron protein 2 [Geobacter sp. OR-1]
MTQQIALYGKGGVGKTTLAANLSAALAEAGKSVMLVGCDLKSDTGILVHGRQEVATLLDYIRSGGAVKLSDLVVPGYRGIACVEVGDSLAEEECASRGIAKALQLLGEFDLTATLKPEFIIYDIPGEAGCSGLVSHLNLSLQLRTFIVTSGDLMSFYAANSYIRSVSRQFPASALDIIGNSLTGSFEESFVADFASQVNTRVSSLIPRSLVVRHSELYGKTVIEAAPESSHAQLYRKLARQVIEDRSVWQEPPKPLSVTELRGWAQGWGDRLGELEFGILKDGAGI